jgi:hypothetical protein
MPVTFPTGAARAPMAVLAAAIVLALAGITGVLAGVGNNDSKHNSISAAEKSTSTTTYDSSDTSLPGAVSVPTTGVGAVTTLKPATATTKPSTATTQADAPTPCHGAAAAKDPGAQKPPAVGTYTYSNCADGGAADTLKVSAGADPAHRVLETSTPQGAQTETRRYGPGVIREKFTIAYGGANVACDWNPDIVQYPAQLQVGTQWQVDSSCEDPTYKVKVHATGTAKVVGRVLTKVGDTTVTVWSVDSNVNIVVSGPVNQTQQLVSTTYYEPTSGLEVYEKVTANGQTVEKVLKSLSPS